MSIHSHFVMHHTWTSLPSFGSPFRRTSFFNSLTYSTTSSLFSHLPFCHFPHIETFRYIHPFSGDCRMACWSDRRCVAASALAAKDKSVLCRLSSKGPFDSTLDDSPNATYIFWNGVWTFLSHFPLSFSLTCSLTYFFPIFFFSVFNQTSTLSSSMMLHSLLSYSHSHDSNSIFY